MCVSWGVGRAGGGRRPARKILSMVAHELALGHMALATRYDGISTSLYKILVTATLQLHGGQEKNLTPML